MTAPSGRTGTHGASADSTGRIGHKLVLLCGFVLYLAALLIAARAQATDYELSIYASTPLSFWIAIGLVLVIGVGLGVTADSTHTSLTATVLGGLSMTTIAGLPLVRGYRFYGSGDALTHLGWAREFAGGTRELTSLIYPAGHISSVSIAHVTGLPVRRALMLFVFVTVVLYVVFVPLVARVLGFDHRGIALATLSGSMLLPITNVSTYLQFHPYTFTVFFLPLIVYLVVRYVPVTDDTKRVGGYAPTGVVLVAVLVSLILFHPQPALNVLILLVAVVLFQRYRRRRMPEPAADRLRSLRTVTVVFGVGFFLWVLPQSRFYALLFGLVEALLEALQGTEAVGENVQQRGGSLRELGVSLESMFLRLFLAQAVYIALASGVVLTNLVGTLRKMDPTTSTTVSYLFVGGTALLPFFLFHFVGDISGFFFRHIGFGMALATLLGSIGLVIVLAVGRGSAVEPVVRSVLVVVLGVLLLASVLTMFPSPFLFESNQHVTEAQLTGHERAFETAAPAVSFAGIRTGPGRYVDASQVEASNDGGVVPRAVMDARNLTEYFQQPQYVLVGQSDVEREVRAYDELRYSAAGFVALAGQDGVDRVRANGDLTVYYVEPASPDEPERPSTPRFPENDTTLPGNRTGKNRSIGETTSLPSADRPVSCDEPAHNRLAASYRVPGKHDLGGWSSEVTYGARKRNDANRRAARPHLRVSR